MRFLLALLTGLTLLLTGCASVSQRLAEAKPYVEQINWPDEYKPAKATFFVHNEIEIAAEPQVIWDILIQAETWPEWYSGAKNVQMINSQSGLLTEDSSFNWKTMGLNFNSSITEFVPPYRLSWESRKSSIQGYHAWLIIPTDEGSRLITQESQNGWLASLEKVFQPNKLERLHDEWLQAMKTKAENSSTH